MVVPFALGSDQRYIIFLIEIRNRDIKAVDLLCCSVAVGHLFRNRIDQLCAVLLGIL